MRILLDTNVIFSAFAARGLAQAVFELCLENHTIVISEPILFELSTHLRKKLKMPDEKAGLIIDYLKESCFLGQEAPVKIGACRDKEDLHILGLAEKMQADFIVTGDRDLLVLKKYRQTSIVTPREFWEKEKKRRSRL
ncbi:MAG: putative toxin-antitoxin system toxin component, PIN family [Candidatus Aminicenantes bacterium RBG_19FT_COMBO_58_17]|jgi:putative PIN family toxin of toxin-antitoxin system|nr:MAG: putative toxin-antitoxin system toxin component, PIN family [Candidatus Aminicenantes bacterium RBG_19FT_COMBO_58_17]HCS49103.1 putative toxin-antitoxin system toxin component, PIN family [Candidatus Aminicenantes bacterium]